MRDYCSGFYTKPGALQNANPKYVARLEAVAKKRGFQSYEEFYWRGLESIAKTHGFPNYGEFIQLSATVALILTGINAETKVFTEPKDVLEDQIAFLARTIAKMNKDLMAAAPGEDPAKVLAPIAPFQQTLDEMMEGRATLQEKTDPANVELVLKYFNQIIWIGGGRTLSK